MVETYHSQRTHLSTQRHSGSRQEDGCTTIHKDIRAVSQQLHLTQITNEAILARHAEAFQIDHALRTGGERASAVTWMKRVKQ